jgi:GDP-L-fucose synthase
MSILVAGATGLVGSAIVRELNATGKPNVGISSKDIDLLDRAATFKFVKEFKPDVVIDAAARVGGISANNAHPVDFLTQNIQIQSNLMDAAHEAGVKNFVFLKNYAVFEKNTTYFHQKQHQRYQPQL